MDDFLSSFIENVVNKPEVFFTANQNTYLQSLEATKQLYDLGKSQEPQELQLQNPFQTLLIDGFDNEQIWQQINMQNKQFLEYVNKQLDAIHESIEPDGSFRNQKSNSEIIDDSDEYREEKDDTDEGWETEDDDDDIEYHDSEGEEDDVYKEEEEEEEEDEDEDKDVDLDEDEDMDIDEENDFDENSMEPDNVTSQLDDEFFSLAEFNRITDENSMPSRGSLDDDDSDDDEIDYFADPGDQEKENANDITYTEFFDPPRKGKKGKAIQKQKSRNTDIEFEENPRDSDEEDGQNHPGVELAKKLNNLFARENIEEDDEQISNFQKRQEKIKKQIQRLELENVADKDWTLIGEASSKNRPLNSLLEEDLEFDHVLKPVPVITEEITEKLEDIIKQRIIDETFDDVERIRDPNLQPFLPSKLVELDHEKSKKSLAEVYEEDYIKKTSAGEVVHEKDLELKKKHQEIENLFKELCHKLDALSNFHYTPKLPKPEITVITDVPAISMEEVIPMNVSDAALLAPEEVYDKKKGEIKGNTELDSREKKRERAAKKRARKKERTMKEREQKVIERINPGMGNKHAKAKIIDQLFGQKNVAVIDKSGSKKQLTKKKTDTANPKATSLKL